MSAPRPTDRPFHARALLAVGRLIDALSRQFGSEEALFSEFGFLRGYAGLVSDLDEVEESPGLRALATTLGLTETGVDALLILGLVEDDGRFGVLFEALQNSPGQHRPSWGLLSQLLGEEVRPALTALLAAGAARVESRDAPRSEWALRVPLSMWDALGGDPTPALEPGMSYSPPGSLARWEDLTLPPGTREEVERLDVIALRGARRSGRRALLGARARAAGRGLIELEGAPDRDRWREAGALATALNADLALRLELAAGEAISLERPAAAPAKVGVILGLTGGISGALAEAAETLRVRAPEPAVRALLWAQHTGSPDVGAALAPRRVGAGMLVCAARAAHRGGPGRPSPGPAEARAALSRLGAQSLETLAAPLSPITDRALLAVPPVVTAEFATLEARCRRREELGAQVGPAARATLGPGVKAMLHGPSGTGKTLAARLLAGLLGIDVFRVDLSAIVNKYIGETEKNLERLFSRAEALDVVLLLDEGDALLTPRTAVSSSVDRYANLETNYLLQRLEIYEGIVLITTNAVDRVDRAFQRRMDVIVEFPLPDLVERARIWALHLPERHEVSATLLEEVAQRCRLSGGQIRNASLHAALLALERGAPLGDAELIAAIQREYRKLGGSSPLRGVR